MGLLDQLWGALRNTAPGQGGNQAAKAGAEAGAGGQLPQMLLSMLGGGDNDAAHTQGLGNLVQKFQQAGLGDAVQSWISNQRANEPVSPDQVHAALGGEHVAQLSQKTGMGQTALLSMLAAALPKLVDALTPNGQLPVAPGAHGAGRPDQAPGEAEAPRDTGAGSAGEAVNRPDLTEPTRSGSTEA